MKAVTLLARDLDVDVVQCARLPVVEVEVLDLDHRGMFFRSGNGSLRHRAVSGGFMRELEAEANKARDSYQR